MSCSMSGNVNDAVPPLTVSSPVSTRTTPSPLSSQRQSGSAPGLPGVYPGCTASTTVACDGRLAGLGSHWNWANPLASVTTVLDAAGAASGGSNGTCRR